LLALGGMYRLSFPWQAQYYYDRGVEAHKANHLDLARQNYEKALQFNTKDPRIYNNIGLICLKQKHTACAEENYQKALRIESDSGTLYNLGQVYEQVEDLDRAEAQYKQAIALGGPTMDYSLSALSRLYILKGKLEQAIELSERGLKETQKPKVKSALYRNLGWIYWIQTDYTKAEDNLQKALTLQPDRTDAYCLLALVRESQGKDTEALEQWKRCRDGDDKDRIEVLFWQTIAQQRLFKTEKRP
jgi:Tfp pilus assembly protein PilF